MLEGGGTHVDLQHARFDANNPLHRISHKIMSGGWVGVMRRLGEMIESVPT